MPWSRALGYMLLAAVLGAIYFATAPTAPPSLDTAESPTPGLAIESVQIDAEGRTVRATHSDERWTVVEPATAHVPSDLISALVSAVLETAAQPVVGSGDQLVDFGLDAPSARLVFDRAGAPMSAFTNCGHAAANAYRRFVPKPVLSRCSNSRNKTASIRLPRRREREVLVEFRGREPWRWRD